MREKARHRREKARVTAGREVRKMEMTEKFVCGKTIGRLTSMRAKATTNLVFL